jgi:DNA-binding SARP family transcriptional activator
MVLSACLLGQWQIITGGEMVAGATHPRLQELLAYLLLHRDRPLSRQQLAFLFWPDSNEQQSRTNLRNLLFRLRQALPLLNRYLEITDTHLSWRPDLPLRLDSAEFESALPPASAGPDSRLEALERAVSLYTGDLFPECYSDWLLEERERLRQLYLAALGELADLNVRLRSPHHAIPILQQLLHQDPLNENAYALLMHLYAGEGSRGRALQVYHACVETLRSELGVEPGPAVSGLYRQLLENPNPAGPAGDALQLVGRQAEWQQLTRAWGEQLNSRLRFLGALVSGEAGVGKTHLAQAFAGWVQRQGSPVLRAAGYENSQGLAYAALSAWLSDLRRQFRAAFDRLSPIILSELSRLLPELRLDNPHLEAPLPFGEKWQVLHFYESLIHALRIFPGPVLLVLDDIQWCDAESLAWLAFLQSQKGEERIFLLATARTEAAYGHPAVQFFDQLPARLNLPLEPFGQKETRRLMELLLGRPVEDSQAGALYELSEGNSLFVTELVRAGLTEISDPPTLLPERIQTVIHWRLDRLSPPARQIIDLAAVIGRSFTYELLKAAAGLDEGSLVDGLDEAWRVRLLREQGSQGYDFSHALIRLAAYEGLSHARRRLLHGHLAGILSGFARHQPEVYSSLAAQHYALADRAGEAVLHYEKAAQAALELFALNEAANLLEASLQLLPGLPADPRLAARLNEQAGRVYLLSGDYDRARQAYSQAQACLPTQQAALTHARLLRNISESWAAQHHYSEAGDCLQLALQALGDSSPSGQEADWQQEWLEIHLRQMSRLYFLDRADEMQSISDLIEAPLRQHGNLEQQADYYSLLGMLANRKNRFRVDGQGIGFASRALELAEKTGSPLKITSRRFSLGFNLLWSGSPREAIPILEQALAQAERLGSRYIQSQVLAYLSIAHRMRGETGRVRRLAPRSLELAENQQHLLYQGVALANLGWLAYRLGNLEEAERLSLAALERWRDGYPMAWLADFPLAGVAYAAGNLPQARQRFQAMLSEKQQRLPAELEQALLKAAAPPAPDQETHSAGRALVTAHRLGYL